MDFIIRNLKMIVGIGVALVVVCYIWSPSDKNDNAEKTQSVPALHTNEVGKQIVESSRGVRKQHFTYPVKWSYEGGVVADNLKLKNVSKISAGILVDANSGKILWSKKSQIPQKIASMTKMMTTLLAVKAIEEGQASFEDEITVSKAAAGVGGSQVYLAQGEVFTLNELLQTIMIKSANDSSHLVAEAIGESYDDFVADMNAEAISLGMKKTKFYNPHGLPIKNKHNRSSALDMAILGRELLKYQDVLDWSSTWVAWFRDNKMMLRNHNPLVNPRTGVKGVDGLKTGYYSSAGFCITATAMRDGRRLIAVVIGVKNQNIRNSFTKELIEWGYDKVIPKIKG